MSGTKPFERNNDMGTLLAKVQEEVPLLTDLRRDVPIKIAAAVKIALAKKDNAGSIALLETAVATQDTLKYSEPEDWFFPVRESLGGALLMNGDSAGAEKVFRQDLEAHPRNPRSLFGLHEALKTQGRDHDAQFVEKQFRDYWDGGTVSLKVENLV